MEAPRCWLLAGSLARTRTCALRPAALLATIALFASAAPAHALDKQGSAHGGAVGGDEVKGFNVSGALMLGSALVNPSYAARPDNSGIALFRYALHADIDLWGRALSIPLDVNLFTDRTRKGARVFAPTELDVITGVTTTRSVGKGDLELGARVELDNPVDVGGFSQTYVDVRARYLYSLAKYFPSLARDLADGDFSGYATFGWFTINPTYAARPDNTGLALFRYVLHSELSVYHDHFSIGLDGACFSDRQAANVLGPSELDVTYEAIGRLDPFELHVAYERDMPLDRSGLVQQFLYALVVYNFDLKRDVVAPVYTRGNVISP